MRLDIIKKMDVLVDNYIFPNRSSLVNYCVDRALPIIVKELKPLRKNIENYDLPNVLEFLKQHGFVIHHNHTQPKVKVPLGNIYFNSNNDKDLLKIIK